MARQLQAAEVNTFIKGFITEASPLTFPANATIDEKNMTLNRDGSRQRRLGMDYEVDYNVRQVLNTDDDAAFTAFRWTDVGGIHDKTIQCFQVGRYLLFFDNDVVPLSSGIVYTHTFTVMDEQKHMDFTLIDGLLIVVNGEHDVHTFEYVSGSIVYLAHHIHGRDVWGVEDTLLTQEKIGTRPTSLSDEHVYNLRNQTYAFPRMYHGGGLLVDDPIERQWLEKNEYPSNSDSIYFAFYPDANDATDRLSDRFNPADLDRNPSGNAHAPQGHFIIDVLKRGADRITQINSLHTKYSTLSYQPSTLPTDFTSGGAHCCAEWAGRCWFGGFNGDVTGGDDRSPHLSSYIFFSRLVQSFSDIAECYQVGDPTSREGADLVATDGGFIRLENAFAIEKLVNMGQSLIILARNGVWRVVGGTETGFSATGYIVEKITEHGITSRNSVVEFDNTIFYWADDGIYHIAPNEFGDIQAKNISQNTIQTHLDSIVSLDKLDVTGVADKYSRQVRWLYHNHLEQTGASKEIILDLNLQAFSINSMETISGDDKYPRVTVPFVMGAYRIGEDTLTVTVGGFSVTVNGDDVTVVRDARIGGQREVGYMIVSNLTMGNGTSYTFGTYRDQDFIDFKSYDGTGVDADAYMVTGWTGAGDYQRYKQIPYLTMHFERTESGFEDLLGDGNLTPKDESSCQVQVQWEWANSAASNRWGNAFEAYRYRRQYIPAGVGDSYDSGFELITTKNRLRGKGRVFSFKMSSSPQKDMRVVGWSMVVGSNTNV